MFEICGEYDIAFRKYLNKRMFQIYNLSKFDRKKKQKKQFRFRYIEEEHIKYFRKIMSNVKTKNLTID
jgi:hypothetical protein